MINGKEDRPSTMRRGELAKQTGCNIETIRFYEHEKLIPEPPRTAAGHRLYDHTYLKRVLFIRRCRELGFKLSQVRGLLQLVDGSDYTCSEVHEAVVEHLSEIKQKITDLKKISRVLSDMAATCEEGEVPVCPVIEHLFAAV